MVTDSSGTVIDNVTYAPYGEITQGGAVSRFDYEGKEYSSVVGDYDFHFRKYCVQFGIFCQPDTLIQNVYDPQSLNRYMFERGNPYKYIDPTGHQATPGDYASTIGRYVTIISGLIPDLNAQAAEKRRYDALYEEARRKNPDLPSAYTSSLIPSGPTRRTGTLRIEERRFSIRELEEMIGKGSGMVQQGPLISDTGLGSTGTTTPGSPANILLRQISSRVSNPLVYNIVRGSGDVFAEGLTGSGIRSIRSGGSARTSSGSTVFTMPDPSTGETILVKITPIK